MVNALFWWSCSQLIDCVGDTYDIRIHCFGGLGVECLLSQYLGDGSRGIRNSGHSQSSIEFKASLSYRRPCFKKEESEEAAKKKKQ